MSAADTMQPTVPLSPSARFFWNHAPWATLLNQDPAEARTECANDLANAEAAYLDAESLAGFKFRVRANRKTRRPPTWTMWIEQADGQCVAWLDDVADNGAERCRVVRAELSIDAAETMQAALMANAA